MTSVVASCYICRKDNSTEPIFLPDGEAVFVGRSIDTKITDTQCSRKQVRLVANYEDYKVTLQQLGAKPSSLNGKKTNRNAEITARHGDNLEIISGKYQYRIEFNPPPKPKSKKKAMEFDCEANDSPNHLAKRFKKEDEEKMGNSELQAASCSKETSDKSDFSIFNSNKKLVGTGVWKEVGNGTVFMYTSEGVEGRKKIAGYDMDGTLINTVSGLVFPKDCNDWKIANAEVPTKIKQIYEEGYKVVILSNQGRLRKGKISLNDFKFKIEQIVKRIGVPMQVFLAEGRNIYRKPCIGTWEMLEKEYNDGVVVDRNECFFVGDAAGRPAGTTPFKKKKDHSSVDRLLAENLGIKFFTPEEHFLGHKSVPHNKPSFDPKLAVANAKLLDPPHAELVSKTQEVIVMVGSPGSGKSHFAMHHLPNYHHVNRDSLRTWQKCVSSAEEALFQGKSIVVDNTNPDVPSRQKYLDLAKKHKVRARCFVMAAEPAHVKHNNKFRDLIDATHEKISDLVINTYLKKLVPPSENEGFAEIVHVHFVPKFRNDEERNLYEMFLLEN